MLLIQSCIIKTHVSVVNPLLSEGGLSCLKKKSALARWFLQELVRAGTWGLIFLVVMGVFIFAIKQDIKEGIAFGIDRFIFQSLSTATNPNLMQKTR
jgi:hypothetical protein